MISFPTYSVATGSSARTRRSSSVPTVRRGDVCQTSARNGGRLRSAPQRSRSVRCGGGPASRPAGLNAGAEEARPPMLY
jgi:hypothetical protein